ncbi:hypothetical protein D8V62_23760 [Salmonella enterica]|nr:hypothetical protein [Salmonella enterica]
MSIGKDIKFMYEMLEKSSKKEQYDAKEFEKQMIKDFEQDKLFRSKEPDQIEKAIKVLDLLEKSYRVEINSNQLYLTKHAQIHIQ